MHIKKDLDYNGNIPIWCGLYKIKNKMITGPNIIDDGLIFGYDADDKSSKFYKGEPTIIFDVNIVDSRSSNRRNDLNIVGGAYIANNMFDGSIASLKIYNNRSLTSDEIMQSFNKDKKRFGL
jgi:hypothetical protein